MGSLGILLNGFQTIVKQIHMGSLGILLNGFQTIDHQRFTGSRWVILLNGFKTIVEQIQRESLGYTFQRVLDYCPVDSRASLGYSSQRALDYCPVDSQGVAGLFFSTGSRKLSSRFTGRRWVILLNAFQTIVQQILRESLGYSSQRVLDYCPVDSHGVAGLYFSAGSRLLSSRFTGVAGLFFSTGSRLLYSRFSGSRWVILLNGFQTIVQQIFTGSRCVILHNGFQTIVQQIHREQLGYSSQRVLDYCQVDSQGVAGLFFSTGSRLLSNRFTGSRWVILLNGFQTIVQQIRRESLGYSSRRVQDYCPVDSQGVAGLFFSTGSRLLSSRFTGGRWLFFSTVSRLLTIRDSQGVAGLFFSTGSRLLSNRFTGSRWVILLNGFQTIVQQIHRESLGYSSQRVLDYCPVDSQGVAVLFFSTGSRLLPSRFTGSRWVILLHGFQTIVKQIHRESLGLLLNGFWTIVKQIHRESLVILLNGFQTIVQQIFTGSRWVILLNGFQTIVQQFHRESLGYSFQLVPDYCPVDSQGVAGLFFSKGSRILSSRYSQGVAGIFFSTGSRLLSSRLSGSRCVILLNGLQTIVQQIHRETLGYSSQRVPDYCTVDSQGVAGLFFSTGSRLLSSRFTWSRRVILFNWFQTIVQQIHGTRWVILSNGFQTIVKQIHRGSLGILLNGFQTIDHQRFTGSRWVILFNGFQTIVQQIHGRRWVILPNGLQTIVQQIHRESPGYSSLRALENCPVDSQGDAGLFFSTRSRLLYSRFSGSRCVILLNMFQTIVQQIFTGSRWVILLNGFKTIFQQIHRESLGYSSQRVLDN